MQLTKNFTLNEFFVSKQYPNIAANLYRQMTKGGSHSQKSEKIIDSLFLLCHFILQPARHNAGMPMKILSGYRSKDLNVKIGGSSNSRHMLGKAADFTVERKEKLPLIFEHIRSCLRGHFGELILYRHKDGTPNFIHVSLPRLGTEVNVKEVVK